MTQKHCIIISPTFIVQGQEAAPVQTRLRHGRLVCTAAVVGPGVFEHGSVSRTLDLRDLTRRRSDRESDGGQPVPVVMCAGVMSRPRLLMPAPASEIDVASHPSPSSHPLLIPDLPNPRPTRPTPLIRHPLSAREPPRQPFNPFFDNPSHQTLHHHRRNPPNPYPVATPASPTAIVNLGRPQHQTPTSQP